MEHISTILTWMGIIGFPSIFAILVWCFNQGQKIKILMKSQQAQMRTKLLELYHKYYDQGWLTEEEMEDWENQYQAYHSLGQNGILDARRQTLLALPNTKPRKGN